MKILNNNLFIGQQNKAAEKVNFARRSNYMANSINSAKLTPLSKDTISFSGNNQKTKPAESATKEFTKTVDETCNALQKMGVKPSREDIFGITKKCNFSPEIIKKMAKSQIYYEKAVFLNNLIDVKPEYTQRIAEAAKAPSSLGQEDFTKVFDFVCTGQFDYTFDVKFKDFKELPTIQAYAQKSAKTPLAAELVNNTDLLSALADDKNNIKSSSIVFILNKINQDEGFAKSILNSDNKIKEIRAFLLQEIKNYSKREEFILMDLSLVLDSMDNYEDGRAIDYCVNILSDIMLYKSRMQEPEVLEYQELGNFDKKEMYLIVSFGTEPFDMFKKVMHSDLLKSTLSPAEIFETVNTCADIDFMSDMISKKHFVNVQDCKRINKIDVIGNLYEGFLAQGIDGAIASVMANIKEIKNYPQENISDLAEFLTLIKAQKPAKTRTSEVVSKFLKENPDIDLKDFNNYIKTINFDEIAKFAPAVDDFYAEQYLDFTNFHYKNGTREFSKDTLSFDIANGQEFSDYLAQNLLNSDDLTKLLAIYPATSTKVGEIPKDWFDGKMTDEKVELIYSEIAKFGEEQNVEEFEKNLGSILGKEVKLDYLDRGAFGWCYKVSIQGAKDTCLKIYANGIMEFMFKNINGTYVEAQNAVFANENSNNFVKMFFGKLAPYNGNNGFLVTQYLDNIIEPINTKKRDVDFEVISTDTRQGKWNMINSRIIDFGQVEIKR